MNLKYERECIGLKPKVDLHTASKIKLISS